MTIAFDVSDRPDRAAGRRLLATLRSAHDADAGLATVVAAGPPCLVGAAQHAVTRRLLDMLRTAHDADAALAAVGAPAWRNLDRASWVTPAADHARHRGWRATSSVRLVPSQGASGEPVRVFISYSHAPAQHAAAVNQAAMLLRRHGIDARIDTRDAGRPRDWALWILEQLREAAYVLVIASPEYRRRAEGLAGPGEGRGVAFEAFLMREAVYADPAAARQKFLPVLLPGGRCEDIPAFLGPTTGTRYRVGELTPAGIAPLLRVLTRVRSA
jgi:TIR domain